MWTPLGGAPRKTGKPANCEVANSCNCGGALCIEGACCIAVGLRACGFQGLAVGVGVSPRGG